MSQERFPQGTPLKSEPLVVVDKDALWKRAAVIKDAGVLKIADFRDDEMWLVDVAHGCLYALPDKETLTFGLDVDAMPNGALFIDLKSMLISDRALGLYRFTPATGRITPLAPACGDVPFQGLNSLCRDGVGGIYFTDAGNSSWCDRSGKVYYAWLGDGNEGFEVELICDGLAFPTGIAISPDGEYLYVSEFGSNSIICMPSVTNRESKDTPFVYARFQEGHGPDGLAVDELGNVYAAHLGAREVVVGDAAGNRFTTVQLPDCAGPLVSSVAVHDNHLFVSELSEGTVWAIALSTK